MNDALDDVHIGLSHHRNASASTVVVMSDTEATTGAAPGKGSRQPSGGVQSPLGAGTPSALVRPRRRVVSNVAPTRLGGVVKRNYAVAGVTQFTNFSELKNDMVSPEFAQELLEQTFTHAGLDTSDEKAMRQAEDVVFTFYVQNAASQKTGHEKVVDIYGVEFDLMVMLNVLVSNGVTPRRFTRGLAGRIHAFLREPENAELRADLVRSYSLSDPDHAVLAFDGSTHIPNLPVEQIQVANMLAQRGIFENAASVKNASERTTYDGVLTRNQTDSGALHLGR